MSIKKAYELLPSYVNFAEFVELCETYAGNHNLTISEGKLDYKTLPVGEPVRDPKRIAFGGAKKSGKSRAAGILDYTTLEYGSYLKRLCAILFAIPDNYLRVDKTTTIPGMGVCARHVMQTFGTTMRGLSEDIFVDMLKMDLYKYRFHNLCIPDIRYANEHKLAMRYNFNCYQITWCGPDRTGDGFESHASEQYDCPGMTVLNNFGDERFDKAVLEIGQSLPSIPVGRLELIMGCMFAGKTSELIRRARMAALCDLNVVVIKNKIDDRYSDSKVVTHDRVPITAVVCDDISKLHHEEDYPDWDVICIDEGQFFKGLIRAVQNMMVHGKRVIVAGLDGTFDVTPFKEILGLVCYADKIDKLSAICMCCKRPNANFSYKKSDTGDGDSDTITIGGSEMYEARCRQCFDAKY